MPTSDAQKRANKKWREANKERHDLMKLEWNKLHPERMRKASLKCYYKRKAFIEASRDLMGCLI